MANTSSAFGLKPVRHLDGSPWNGNTVKCYISASYATALFIGDPVLLTPTLAEKDATGMHPTINLSADPIEDTEVVSLNGLEIDSSNYSISGKVLTMIVTQLKISDIIYINYIGCK